MDEGLTMTEIFILAAQRSAIGSYGGSLKNTSPIDLAIPVAKDAIKKSGLPADAVQHATYGHVIHTEPRDMYSPLYFYWGWSTRNITSLPGKSAMW